MSFGHSSAVRFDVNHGAPGIFWQKNNPKVEKRKFGYKTKSLRHDIRQPDNAELFEEIERKKEEEKQKFNRDNKDFIQRNKGRYKPREQVPPPGSTHISPGTVTLTQDQLAALLTSLSTLNKGDGSKSDNPLKISFDADTNKIEVQRYESDDGGASGDEGNDEIGGRKSPALGIYDLLGDGDIVTKNSPRPEKEKELKRSKKRSRGSERDVPHEARKNVNNNEGSSPQQNTARSTLEDVKKEAGVSHIPSNVPLKHMTVGERKRLQWAMERAEIEKDYDPWGKPGAGAPMGNAVNSSQEKADKTREIEQAIKAKNQKQREDLESDIERLRREIGEAEKQKEDEEQQIIKKILDEKNKKESKREKTKEREHFEVVEKRTKKDGSRREQGKSLEKQQKKNRDDSTTRNENVNDEKVQIVVITKKKAKNMDGKKQKGKEEEEEISFTLNSSGLDDEIPMESYKKREKEEKRKSKRDKDVDELPQESHKAPQTSDKPDSKKEAAPSRNKPAATDEEEETAHLSKKEIERRKWVAELNKQRDEQRLKKQMEKERDKAGVQDQWADRFVYHKSPEQTSPRRERGKPSVREELPTVGRAQETATVTFDTPHAMRSSMVVGAGTLNETRYDSKKADEKKQWLEELDRQREEKRQLEVARKEKERQEDGMWADRYPTDRHKINQFIAQASKSPRQQQANSNVGGETNHQRVGSAPESAAAHPPVATSFGVSDSQEQPTTFLRGQGVNVDPVTRREQEEKRRLHMEYQAEIKAQIEEKERLKREEKGRKAREDMEEERKFQQERDRVKGLEEAEQKKNRDREAMQQKNLATLKSAMEDAEEKAKEEKNLRRIQHLQQRGHDISQLKATYEAITPRIKEYDSMGIPGLGQSGSSPLPSEQVYVPAAHTNNSNTAIGVSPRGVEGAGHYHHHPHPPPQQQQQHRVVGQSYTKEPYVEDRVLTPSRNRAISKPRVDLNSPSREFGTQTLDMNDLQSILSSLPDDIQIEYKMKVEEALKGKQEKKPPAPARKVHSKSADDRNIRGVNTRKTAVTAAAATKKDVPMERRVASKDRGSKAGERPQWGQRKVSKAVTKNSEKDPFYQQKKEESEARKAKRERQLQYLQELNKERIPNQSPTRNARAASPDGGMMNPAGGGDRGRGRDPRGRVGRRGASLNKNTGKGGAASPNILTLANDIEANSKNIKAGGGGAMTGRSSSPPLPTVKHNTVGRHFNDDNDPYFYTNSVLKNSQSEGRYDDLTAAMAAPVHDGDFIPFTRTTEILDPAKAADPLAISRENSRMERARNAYHQTRQPANRGQPLNVLQDRERESALKTQPMNNSNNPIFNPHLVTDHPTGRQDQILQQLSSLKQNLMQRRKELENYMEPTNETG